MQLAGADLRILYVFDAVVRNGGFSAAQAELNISQPTISNHISTLEKRLGMKLCQRGRSGFSLTEKGKIVHELTQNLLGSISQFSSDINSAKGHLVGELNIGMMDCISTDANSKLPQAISKFDSRKNDVIMHFYQHAPQKLQEKVLDGKLHMAIGSFRHQISGLSYTHLYKEKQSLYCSDSHPFFKIPESKLETSMLLNHKIVGRGYWRKYYEKNFGFNDIRGIVHHIEPQLILILSGRYLGFLPEHYAQNLVKQKRLRRLLPDQFTYDCDFDLIMRSGYRRTSLVETFINDLISFYSN